MCRSSPGPGADYDDDDEMMRAPSRGRGSGRGMQRGICQVEGCGADLSSLRDYHQRYKVSPERTGNSSDT